MRLVGILVVALFVDACVTPEADEPALSFYDELTKGKDFWHFKDCQVHNGEDGVDLQAVPVKLALDVKISSDQALDLVFVDEIGQVYTLAGAANQSRDSSRMFWKGVATLKDASDLDERPVSVAFERIPGADGAASVDVLYTKGTLPDEYLEEGVESAFSVQKYSSKGESYSAVVMKKPQESGYDYYIERTCGAGFGHKASLNRQPVQGAGFETEIGI